MVTMVKERTRSALKSTEKQNVKSLALEELKKFFQLAVARHTDGKMTGMPSCYLDTVWHQLHNEPDEYERFCVKAVGFHLDHIPYNGEGVLEWVPEYEAMFGTLPPVWFTDLDGNLNESAYDEYVETGVVKASWNCGPLKDDRVQK